MKNFFKNLGISLIVFSIIYLVVAAAFGQDWINTNQATVAWDAVQYEIDQGERLIYRTYLANAKTDPNKINPAFIGETDQLQYQFTFTEKGSYFVGLKTVVQVEESGTWQDVAESEIGWSDDPLYAQGGQIFGLRYYPVPLAPVGMRPVLE